MRAAISAQGAGLLEDIGRTIGKLTRRLDDSFERIVRRIFFRRRRAVAERPRRRGQPRPGLRRSTASSSTSASPRSSRSSTLVDNAFGGSGDGASNFAIAVGSTAWLALGGALPGRLLVAGRADAGDALRRHPARPSPRLPLRRSLKRLIGLGLSVVTFGIGFLGIVFGERRRGWDDRFAGTDVVYDEPPPGAGARGRDAGRRPP